MKTLRGIFSSLLDSGTSNLMMIHIRKLHSNFYDSFMTFRNPSDDLFFWSDDFPLSLYSPFRALLAN